MARPEPEVNGSDGPDFPWWIVIVVVVGLLIALGISLLVIENTSYAIQMAVFRGGTIDQESVISLVQDRPGINFRELRKVLGYGRRDLVSTLVHLERAGIVRPIPDGTKVRFYPTVGSFVEGPLTLSKQQERIVRALLDVPKMSHRELSDATGIPGGRIGKEATLLELKGVLRKKKGREPPEYFMSAREKKWVREWIERR